MKSHIDKENDNVVFIGRDVDLNLRIDGKHNKIKIGDKRNCSRFYSRIAINIFGDNNKIFIGSGNVLRDLTITVGNHIKINNTITKIGKNFSTNPGCIFLISLPSSRLTIGDNCIFSRQINIRTGEIPHLIFDIGSGEYVPGSGEVQLGNHVWIGEFVYICKNVLIPDNCVVGAYAVVTKNFDEENCLIAGNPAGICKRNIAWFVDRTELPNDTIYAKNFDKYWEEKMRLPSDIGKDEQSGNS